MCHLGETKASICCAEPASAVLSEYEAQEASFAGLDDSKHTRDWKR